DKQFGDHPGPRPTLIDGQPPGKAVWDLALVRQHFEVLRVAYDTDVKHVTWLLQAKRGFPSYVSSVIQPRVRFYDGDDARVHEESIAFSPDRDVRKGERIRATVPLPREEVRERVKRVLLVRPEDKLFGDHPGPKLVDSDRQPPGKATWDVAPLRKHFDVLAV